MSFDKDYEDTDINERKFDSPQERAKALADLEEQEEKEFGTPGERAQAVSDIVRWAGHHDSPDEPIMYFDLLTKERFFTPRQMSLSSFLDLLDFLDFLH